MLYLFTAFIFTVALQTHAESLPKIISDPSVQEKHFLPNFSYAGFSNGEKLPETQGWKTVDVGEHGIIANDGRDDSKALIALLEKHENSDKPVVIQFKPGQYIISSIIYIGRSNIVLRGAGSGLGGTVFYFPRPLLYVPDPPELKELNEYLVSLKKIQKQKSDNIYIPFSSWSWSGGFFWTRVKGQRVKNYLEKYNDNSNILTHATKGKQNGLTLEVKDSSKINIGDIVEIKWLSSQGQEGEFLKELYPEKINKIGCYHWTIPDLELARQPVKVTAIDGNTLTIYSPLLHNIIPERKVTVTSWAHLNHVGLEHFSIKFPYAEPVAHHCEQGFNGIYLTRVYDSWVDDVRIENADSGILTEEIANVSINNVKTEGKKLAHYTVQMGCAHNTLVRNLKVYNKALHPLSFNTYATKSVYQCSHVECDPILDQHSGVNQQNLFDDLTLVVTPDENRSYNLFKGGGASYWKPSHGAYSTFWNINVNFTNGHDSTEPVVLKGMTDGPRARLIGIHGNHPVKIKYEPAPYIEKTNVELSEVPSLYKYQLKQRLQSK
ncbi:MAG: hypothetical protein HQL32_04240 [Planctomycetes bacterium]|nr:hypothetical protein [Planctomycetota bacterium]